MMTASTKLETRRLLLTKLATADLDDLVRMYADPQVTATLGGVRTADWVAEYLKTQMAHWDEHGFGFWTVRDRLTGEFIGRGGLRYASIEGRREVEVGYGFRKECWGRGLATELAIESVRIGFTELQLSDVVSFTLTTNLASKRVMEKAGLRYERDIVYAGLPHVLYRQTTSQWQTAGGHAFADPSPKLKSFSAFFKNLALDRLILT